MDLDKRLIKDTLTHLGVTPSKERGQNFLIDHAAIQSIVEFGRPARGEHIVEIGPGLGALTDSLASRGLATVIELEPRFCELISEKYPELEVLNEDVRMVDFTGFDKPVTIFGNLPYSASTDILFHILENGQNVKRAIFLLQKEFVERMAAPPGSRTRGTLSVNVQLLADVYPGPVIPNTAFHPQPKVDSMLVELLILPETRVAVEDLLWFKRVVNACFLKKRKKILNSLLAASVWNRSEIEKALKGSELDPAARAESLELEQFAKLAQCLPKPADYPF